MRRPERAYPLGVALALHAGVTLGIPWLHGAADDAGFAAHARIVLLLTLACALVAWLVPRIVHHVAGRAPRVRPSRHFRWSAHAEHHRRHDPNDDPPRRAGGRPPPARAR